MKITDYEILETEYGVIPMSDEPHDDMPDAKTIRIANAGGYVKPSTGYSFQRTQTRLQKLVTNLECGIEINGSKADNRKTKWKRYMDFVLLNVFTHLFDRNGAKQVLKFLDEATSLSEDFRIVRSVPILPFSKAAIEVLLKK